jgi:hypothetical protein
MSRLVCKLQIRKYKDGNMSQKDSQFTIKMSHQNQTLIGEAMTNNNDGAYDLPKKRFFCTLDAFKEFYPLLTFDDFKMGKFLVEGIKEIPEVAGIITRGRVADRERRIQGQIRVRAQCEEIRKTSPERLHELKAAYLRASMANASSAKRYSEELKMYKLWKENS